MKERILLIGDSSEIAKSLRKKALEIGHEIHIGYNKITSDNKNDPTKTYVDTTDKESIENLVLMATRKLGGIDHLVYTSGISEERWSTEQQTWEEVNRIIQINLTGAIYIATQFSKTVSLDNKKNKSIVLVSSESGEYGGQGIAIYAATKAALNTFARGYARELRKKNCRINVVSPGKIEKKETDTTRVLEEVGSGADVAEAILWLISERSSYCSGTKISVSGGK